MTPTEFNVGLGTFLTANVVAKVLYNDHWFNHQRSNIRLAQTILATGQITEGNQLARLQRYIQVGQFKLNCIKNISRVPFLPLAAVAAAYNYFRK